MATNETREFPGTYLFDSKMAKKGYGLNKMCYSFNNQEARDEFNADPDAYCDKFNLSDAQKVAIKEKDIIAMLREGGSIYYLAKYAGLLKLNMQDIGALQTGMSVDEFKDMLVKNGRGDV
ncbi:Protocatechuate 4,5-dioxygenase alpha chain [Marinomonas gallaica]|uniref:Protocatechuate 4,5-dioxygenase alpha chain n=1 Tax=Marinomonas gallaica TaxID=1806667 RepID=A0A1C3JTW4_9GAMM|nr:protocatechuate 4,5-dioxygenase subunit alpha [Marinomonas gallaica]SBT18577.1 Protocatechuate 4,5-dioxygenase alpha chain [Marinomonas gallaica]SBT21532.1 Protocatechuate 4,5-dioxygenase alpha chain [Marinomonas gallaica]